ncbi:D-arabinono-1,4-lactone oxidase, partial [Streptomyces sp. NPDC001940]
RPWPASWTATPIPIQSPRQSATTIRPLGHWGKRHLMEADALAARYPAWQRFQAVRSRLDPQGTFTNSHLRRVLGPVEGTGTSASAGGHVQADDDAQRGW